MGYENNLITYCIILNQRTELNCRPTDYESVGYMIPDDSFLFITIDKLTVLCDIVNHKVMRKYPHIHLNPNPCITPEQYAQENQLYKS